MNKDLGKKGAGNKQYQDAHYWKRLYDGQFEWSQEVEETDAQIWLDYRFHGGATERLRTSLDLGYRQVVGEERLITRLRRAGVGDVA